MYIITTLSSLAYLHPLCFADKFQHYDMGPTKNMKKYGQPKPPEYDLRKVTSPVVLFYSKNDRVIDSGVSIFYVIFLAFKILFFVSESSRWRPRETPSRRQIKSTTTAPAAVRLGLT